MFWKKKEDNVEIKTANIMFNRLMILTDKVRKIMHKGDYITNDLSIFNNTTYLYLIVETNLGKRYFEIYSSNLMPHTIPQYRIEMLKDKYDTPTIPYFIIGLDKFKTIFEVVAQRNSIEVKPQLTLDGLTAHDIDMAIYELEQIVDRHFTIYKQCKDFHNSEVEKLLKNT